MKLSLALSMALIVAAAAVASKAQNAFPGAGNQPPPRQQPQPQYPQPQPGPQSPQPATPGFSLPAPNQSPPSRSDAQPGSQADPERRDFGVPAVDRLHSGPMHGPTPTSIPGGQLVTTKGLLGLLNGRQAPYLLFDVLGSQEMLPGAIAAVAAAQPGSFDDETQRGFGAYLQQVTRGDRNMALVFYCQSIQCWMSYNAALRAIKLGYVNVLWYRGGVEAWKMAGMQTQRPGGGVVAERQAQPQPQPYPQQQPLSQPRPGATP